MTNCPKPFCKGKKLLKNFNDWTCACCKDTYRSRGKNEDEEEVEMEMEMRRQPGNQGRNSGEDLLVRIRTQMCRWRMAQGYQVT